MFEATIYMVRLIRDRAPDVWKAMDRATTKNAVKDYVATESLFSLTESYFGRIYSWLVTPCGQNPKDAGELSVFDLFFDPDDYRFLSAENLVPVLNATPKVIRSLRANPSWLLRSSADGCGLPTPPFGSRGGARPTPGRPRCACWALRGQAAAAGSGSAARSPGAVAPR